MGQGNEQEGVAAVSGSAVLGRDRQSRARDSTTTSRLLEAARALARSTDEQEVAGIVCAATVDAAGCDVAALIERWGDGPELIVRAVAGAELDGRMPSRGSPDAALRAFDERRPARLVERAAIESRGWPLESSGAEVAIWQPVADRHGVRALIAAGWRSAPDGLADRAGSSLELLAGEAAVALERADTVGHLLVLSRTDPLTDVSNRRAWLDELARELARAGRAGEPLSIALIDLDELKSFNDRWGHPAGDRLLLTAAARWRRRLRLTDLLARIGGDEFAVTLPGCSVEEARNLGDQLRSVLPDGISCSVGVAEWSEGEALEGLHERADQALYAAKYGGRDRVVAAPGPGGTAHWLP